MVYEFTPEQLDRLDACRIQFNRLTGSRQSLKQFISQTITEAIEDSEVAADAVRLVLPLAKGARHVH